MAIDENNRSPRILVAGCGKLGGTIASQLTETAEVFGLRRNASQIPPGVHPVAADLLESDSLADALPERLDAIVYCLTPSTYDDTGYYNAFVKGLENLLQALGSHFLKRLVFVSSSSVYSQNDDSWVNEDSPTEPARYSGRAILQGERLALTSQHPATVVRFSGIYGPSRRRFLESVVNGEMDPAKPAPFSNRIHEADAAAAVCHVLELALAGSPVEDCYLASDCEPARLDEVVEWVRQQVPCQPPKADARKGGRAGSKRCDNRRLRQSGFEFRYPDFRAGYREMIESQS